MFPVFRGEHINFLARLTLGQPAVCAKAIWTLTRAKSSYVYVPFFSWILSRDARLCRNKHPLLKPPFLGSWFLTRRKPKGDGGIPGCCKRSAAKGVWSLFSFSGRFRSLFLMLVSLCRHFFAKLLLPDSLCGRVRERGRQNKPMTIKFCSQKWNWKYFFISFESAVGLLLQSRWPATHYVSGLRPEIGKIFRVSEKKKKKTKIGKLAQQ